jgi:putative glutathione S-transferase
MQTAICGDPKYFPKAAGSFKRDGSNVMNWIDAAGDFPPAQGRYHLILNYACGWSARCLIVRSLKGLEDTISVSHTKLLITRPNGWPMLPDEPLHRDNDWQYIIQAYNWDGLGYGDGSGSHGKRQLSVPLLIDLQTKRVVSNDSAQICIMLNAAFEDFATNAIDLYPVELQPRVEEINDVVYPGINDGVYRCKFAGSDAAYSEAHAALYEAIAFVEATLEESGGPFLCGEVPTLADVRTFPHLYRFDPIYRHMMLRGGADVVSADMSHQDGGGCANPPLPPRVVAYLEAFERLPAVRAACDPELALAGYFNQMGHSTAAADCEALYEANKYGWMPPRADLEGKRAGESLPAGVAAHLDC